MSAGWFDDPTGRFGRRWYDGAAWTEHVVGAHGQPLGDPLPERATPLPPPRPVERHAPTAPPPPPGATPHHPGPAFHPGPPPGLGPGGPGFGPASGVRHQPGAGLAVGVLGLLLVVLGLFALPWADVDPSRFTDLSSTLRDAGSDGVQGLDDWVVYLYGAWAGYLLLALGLVGLTLGCVPLPPTAGGNGAMRMVLAVVAGIAASAHMLLVDQLFPGDLDPEVAAYLPVAGYVLLVVAAVLGARRTPAG
ncbi:hypothetical protein GCM10023340_44900 [Nocardioides marinquilinus]|uniref:DUF2510 domain-containing protein n=1 Tax=Nocardioides marinquilinus TaxID=1210400 RepID=A0ABP9Q4F7_9ACTN